MTHHAIGTFDITLRPAGSELAGVASRFEFTKAFSGDLYGSSEGIMLSAGDPSTGSAGYVAIEAVDAELDGKRGTFCFQQYGVMADGDSRQHYEVVHGSGTGGFEGLAGSLTVTVVDEIHLYDFSYTLLN